MRDARRSWTARACACVFWVLALAFFLPSAHAQTISGSYRKAGNLNYVVTGGSLRAATNSSNACSLNTTSTQALSGIPAGATIVNAFLYWGGSGNTPDSTVSLNGNTVTASRTFTADATGVVGWRFFGGVADVTSLIIGNTNYTFSNLTVTNTAPYCGAAPNTATTSGVVAGWSLIVIYSLSSEPLRAINIFDGLQYFFGSAISSTSSGFRIPTGSIDGRMTVVTWEGDTTNSGSQNGFSESLQFNSNSLGALSYDSLSHFTPGGVDVTTHGVDIDSYNISSFLAPGQTTAISNYSSGQDFVLLTAKVVSVTSEPIVDLALSKSHSGNFNVGGNAVYSLVVSNVAGSQSTDYPITVTDTLPTGLSYVSATGTGWTCGASGQTVTCTNSNTLAGGASLPAITLTASVANAAFPSVTNSASVSTPSYDPNTTNNAASDVTTINGPNLSTSTKTVADLNGGEANPGDVLRYTITVRESAGIAATGVSLTDDVPGNVTGFSVVTIPSGAVNSSTGAGTGANNNGYLNVTGINVPASGSVTVVFDVIVAPGTPPGANIDNTATIDNPAGTDATPSAPQVVVSPSLIPSSGTKQLYLINGLGLTRVRPAAQTTVTIDEGASSTWTLTQPLQKPLTLNAGSFPVQLYLTELDNGSQRNISVTLSNSVLGTIATVGPTTYTLSDVTPGLFTIPLNTAGVTAPVGSTFSLTITNSSSGSGNRRVLVHQLGGANSSRVELNSASVINVDSVATYSAAYPGGSATTSFNRGLTTAYIRAVVSDPFGSFDITGATMTLLDANGATQVNAQAMTQVADSGAATKTYQSVYAIPANAAPGNWTIRITASEGVEGVTDLGVGTFAVAIPMPTLLVSKVSEVLSDPINGTTNPKRIPNSIVRYTITVTNSGPGAVDGSTLAISDVVPANTALYVDTGSGNPIEFIDGSTASGLSFNYASNVSYSNTPGGGTPFSYSPTANADGVDLSVTGLRIAPTGTMSAASGGNQPSFVIRFRVRVR